jgi:hypothetical protein
MASAARAVAEGLQMAAAYDRDLMQTGERLIASLIQE